MSDCNQQIAQEREKVLGCVEKVLAELEHSGRLEKLPPALFDRLLSSVFECNGCEKSAFDLANFPVQMLSNNLFNAALHKDCRHLCRFLIRMFGNLAVHSSTNLEHGRSFFVTSGDLFYRDTSVTSSWLQACAVLAQNSESGAWLSSSGCISRVLSCLKHHNFYISRNAALVVSALLCTFSSNIETTTSESLWRFSYNIKIIADLLNVLLGNVLQFESSSNANWNKIPEHCASECARLLVEFTEGLHKTSRLDPTAVRATFGITLSQEESMTLIRLASQYKRLKDCCIALYCVFGDNASDKMILSGEYIARASLRRLKISAMLQKDHADSDWHLVLEPLTAMSPTLSNLCPYITSVACFLETCDASCGNNEIIQICSSFTSIIQYSDCSEAVGLSCMQFLSGAAKVFAGSQNLTAFSPVISQMINAAENNFSTKNSIFSDRFRVELLRTSVSIIFNFLNGFNAQCKSPNEFILKESERFQRLCNKIESSSIDDFSAAIHFASVEAVLKIVTAFSAFQSNLLEEDEFGIVSAFKDWALSACRTLARCASSNVNFKDVLSAYGHSSRFNVLLRLLLSHYFATDVGLVDQLFTIFPLDKLWHLMSSSFPAIRRSVVAFVFAIAHMPKENLHSLADKMLTDLLESSFDEPENTVYKILNYWSSKCQHHVDEHCECLVEICMNSSSSSQNERKEPGKITELNRLATAVRVCNDVLAFLHSADDLPCVIIGAADGDQDNLDCEES